MARGGVNIAVVRIARDALLARGVRPSIDAVRVELGNTGSKSTIQRYLKELGEPELLTPEMSLDDELVRYIHSLVERLKHTALAALADDRAAFEQEQVAIRQQREVQQAQLVHLERDLVTLKQERHEIMQRELATHERLQASELQRHRLQEAHQQQLQLLEERALQIKSLEDKHRYTQGALEHYQEQHVLQRDQELKRHDAQVQHLQGEWRIVQEQLVSKREELSQLYRDLERISGEQAQQYKDTRRLEQTLQTVQERAQVEQLKHQRDVEQLQALAHQVTRLREKAKQQLFKQRQDQRQLRQLREQLADVARDASVAPTPARTNT